MMPVGSDGTYDVLVTITCPYLLLAVAEALCANLGPDRSKKAGDCQRVCPQSASPLQFILPCLSRTSRDKPRRSRNAGVQMGRGGMDRPGSSAARMGREVVCLCPSSLT